MFLKLFTPYCNTIYIDSVQNIWSGIDTKNLN
jgi:hypothetical protein